MSDTAIVTNDPFALSRAGDDAELIEAERDSKRFEQEYRALCHDPADAAACDAAFLPWASVMTRILQTPPESLVGCAIKLRLLLHPDVGLEEGVGPDDLPCLDQILAVIEREIGSDPFARGGRQDDDSAGNQR